MKKTLNRCLSIFLAIAIIFGSAYVGLSEIDFTAFSMNPFKGLIVKSDAASDGDLTFELSDDGSYYYVSDCNESASGTLVIPSVYNDLPVTGIDSYAFAYCSRLTSVTIPDSVTSIGYKAFFYCTSLSSITISGSVTSIGSSAFCNCESLVSVMIGNGVATIGDYAFAYCSKLTSIVIPGSVTTIGNCAFTNCSGLESVVIGYGVTDIGSSAFYNCSKLTSITIPDSVTTIGSRAFYYCENIDSIILPDSLISIGEQAFYATAYYDNTENWVDDVLYIGNHLIYAKRTLSGKYIIKNGTKSIASSAFSGCRTGFGTSGYRTTGYGASTGFKSLVSVVMPNSVTSISSNAFNCCTSLTGVELSDNLTYIGDSAFASCTNLRKIVIPDSVESIGYRAFYNCRSLGSAKIGNGVISIGSAAFENCIKLKSISIPDSTTSIGSDAFYYCANLESVKIGEGVTSIGYRAFYDCRSLKSLVIPDSVESIGYRAFYKCTMLESVVIGDGVTSIGFGVFYNCRSLKSVTIGNGVTSIDSGMFSNCTSLETITIGNGVTSIGPSAFYNCSNLTSITLPDGVTSIGSNAFYNCSSLGSINIPKCVTTIGSDAFENCSSLDAVHISDLSAWCKISFKYSKSNPLAYAKKLYLNNELVTDLVIPDDVTNINAYAFYKCTSLKSVIVPDSVASIGSYAFYKCTNLESVTIGSGLTSIGSSAFYNCKKLKSITIPDSLTSIGPDAFYSTGYYKNSANWDGSVLYIGTHLVKVDPALVGELKIKEGTKTVAAGAFLNCLGLTSIVIPDSVTDIDFYAFSGCTNIESITIGNGVKSIPSSAFKNWTKLRYVTIGDGVTSIGSSAFYNCSRLESIILPDGIISIGDSAFYNCTRLQSITIPAGVTSVGSWAFESCKSLGSIAIPDSVTNLGNGVFYSCKNLSSVTIGNGVSSIGSSVFRYCSNLTSITLPDSVESIGYSAFEECSSLESINIPKSVTTIGSDAFYKCTSLNSVHISDLSAWCKISFKYTLSNPLAYAQNLYLNNELVTDLVIPDDVNKINPYAFYNCISLESITMNNNITSIGCCAFAFCSSLGSITIPDSVTFIDYEAFYNCPSLETVTIGNGVTSIGSYAFYYCNRLETVIIGNGVKSIYYYAFYGCDLLTDVYYIGTRSEWKKISISSGNYALTSADIEYHNHNYSGAWIVDVKPTCTEAGSMHKDCSECSASVTEEIPPTGHNYGEWVLTKEPSCTPGSAERCCKVCDTKDTNTVYNKTVIIDSSLYPESSHDYDSNISETYNFTYPGAESLTFTFSSSTYVEKGFDYIYIYDSTGALYGEYTGSALEGKTITLEGDSFTIELTSDGIVNHYGFSFDAIAADIINYLDIVKPIGHNYSSEWIIDVAPTCVEVGSKSHHCATCDDKIDITEIDIIDHNYEWEYDIPSFTKVGTCVVCEATIEDVMSGAEVLVFTLNSTGKAYTVSGCLSGYTGKIEIPESYNGLPVTAIATDAFRDCSGITSVVIADSVTSIGGSAFRNCTDLTEIVLPANITSIPGAMCYGCTKLESVAVSGKISSVGGYAFSGCSSLKYVFYAGDEAAWNKIAFGSLNTALTGAIIHFNSVGHNYSPEWTIDTAPSCEVDGSKSHYCTVCNEKIDETVIEALGHSYSVESVEDKHPHTALYVCTICDDEKSEKTTVADCVECNFKLSAIDSSSYMVVSYIGTQAEVEIPATYNNCDITAISTGCFKGNTTVKSINIGFGVTSIGSLAFMNCSSLERVRIPSSVTSIGSKAFYGFTGAIYCIEGSYAQEFAIANKIPYVLVTINEDPIKETPNTQIDFENFVIYTTVNNCDDITDILGLSETALVIPIASCVSGGKEFYGTGTIITVFDGDDYIGDFTLIVGGDTNSDSICDVIDCFTVERASIENAELFGIYSIAADSNLDGSIDIADYQSIVNKAIA